MARSTRRPSALVAIALAAAALTACTPAPTATTTPTPTAAPTEQAPTAPAAPQLEPEGTASDNLPYFAGIVATVWSSEADRVSGRAYIDALVNGGFDRAAMQVTEDSSTVGNAAESIQFAVRWGDECLVGQVGPATGDPVTTVLPGLADGGCLVGRTRPIDW